MTDGSTVTTVLVVGATSGIGRAVAHQLAARGGRLVLAARSPETLEQTRQECVSRGAGDVLVVPTDVGDRTQVEHLFRAAVERFGRIDGVVHGAAVIAYGRFEDVPPEVFDQVMTTNLSGTANVARAALQLFDAQGGGSLVVIGSVLAKIATPYMATYCTSKWGVQGLVRILQIEARSKPGVQVSLVSPGGVDTPIYDQAGTYTGRHGNPPPPVSAPESVAAKVVAALDKPGRDISAGPVNWVMVAGFRLLPAVYDALVGPLMRRLGQGKPGVAATPGNVFDAVPDKEAVHGRWPRLRG
ncbi:SDR family NAD(P)-dependent oxidoreductase [Nocardioides panacis]|uniref:SDR family NAD(P)-dependent oxidoreductase n=1 Tax=Nocardioides panacis TaxID=2849501 RepID=A0A975T140_9ACTN|nr:SDR family NAD(P)-dependent oxidoreductase [Nocardioides panacis]